MIGCRIMAPENPPIKIRIEDEVLSAALTPREFDQKVRDLIPEEEVRRMPCQIDRVVYWRGELPHRRVWAERLWWALGIVVGLIFFYGLYSLAQKGLTYFLR